MALEKFREVIANKHDYARKWKAKTGNKVFGYLCLYGYQTSLNACTSFFWQLLNLRLKLKRMHDDGPISKSLQPYKEEAANEFRDSIKELCIKYGLDACVEKSNAGRVRMPEKGIGPIDVFAVYPVNTSETITGKNSLTPVLRLWAFAHSSSRC